MAATLACIFFLTSANAHSGIDTDGWTSLKKDVFIKKKSITYSSETTVSLWIKVVPGTGSDLPTEARTKLMDKGRDDLAYEYTGYLSEIDCSKNKHRELIAILYDANKNIIHSVQNEQASWEVIASGSSFEAVHRVVCVSD